VSTANRVFLSYSNETRETVEALACRLRGDARLTFWFEPWHSIPGVPVQEQMEEALQQATACAVLIGTGSVQGWQNEQMRTAIQRRVENDAAYRVIPVLIPGATRPKRSDLPPFLRRFEAVEFRSPDDDIAFKRLLAGILGIPPIQVEGYIQVKQSEAKLPPPPPGKVEQGHALVNGIANYPKVKPLSETVLNDARDMYALLTEPLKAGYPPESTVLLLDSQATGNGIRKALADLAQHAGADDTAIVFFSGHGGYNPTGGDTQQYLLPYDCDPLNLPGTAITGDEMTRLLREIKAGRLLVLFDSCHSGGAGDPKGELGEIKLGLSEDYHRKLAEGQGRVVMASSRPDEVSWVMSGMKNSLYTHYLLEALQGEGKTLGDGYVRVFDLFRHVAEHVPTKANQHPVFKAAALEQDFAIALVSR
jgi:hypothetical protein